MNSPLENEIARLKFHVERLDRLGCGDSPTIHFARALLGPAITGMDCDECQAALPEHIEAELNKRPYSSFYDVHHHLSNCGLCSEMYLDLLEIALLFEEGFELKLPSSDNASAVTKGGDEEIDRCQMI
ncbi:MAG: hypothetical protein JXA42_03650 [Anaerolineales bacterium]|nr:hypothetical protein [Anaerolineales bacterium]